MKNINNSVKENDNRLLFNNDIDFNDISSKDFVLVYSLNKNNENKKELTNDKRF